MMVFTLISRTFLRRKVAAQVDLCHLTYTNSTYELTRCLCSSCMFSQTALWGEEVMKQANLGVSSSPLQLSGELLLRFVLTTCNETSTPPHPLVSFQMSFSGEARPPIIFTLTVSSHLRLTLQISFFFALPPAQYFFIHCSTQLVFSWVKFHLYKSRKTMRCWHRSHVLQWLKQTLFILLFCSFYASFYFEIQLFMTSNYRVLFQTKPDETWLYPRVQFGFAKKCMSV